MKKTTRIVGVTLAATMLLSACQGASYDPNDPNLTEAEKKLRQQSAVYTETVVTGGVAGCGIGILAGLLLGGSAEGRAKGAAIGCAAGAALGAATGAYVANKQEQYATREEQLDATIADVKKDNENLAGLIQASQHVIADDKARMDQIDIDLKRGKISRDEAKRQLAKVDENAKNIDQTLAELNKRKDQYNEAAKAFAAKGQNDPQAKALNTEIAQLEKQIAQLQSERDSLAKRRTISRVG